MKIDHFIKDICIFLFMFVGQWESFEESRDMESENTGNWREVWTLSHNPLLQIALFIIIGVFFAFLIRLSCVFTCIIVKKIVIYFHFSLLSHSYLLTCAWLFELVQTVLYLVYRWGIHDYNLGKAFEISPSYDICNSLAFLLSVAYPVNYTSYYHFNLFIFREKKVVKAKDDKIRDLEEQVVTIIYTYSCFDYIVNLLLCIRDCLYVFFFFFLLRWLLVNLVAA